MASLDVRSLSGGVIGSIELDSLFSGSLAAPVLMRDAYLMYEATRRQGTASVKTKGLIAGSKKKLFRQKGTGNARMGQKRTPLRRGGGSAFGKVSKNWGYRLPKKALRVATKMAFVEKLKAGGVSVVDQFSLNVPKTKSVAELLANLSVGSRSCLFVVGEYSRSLWLSVRNIPGVTLTTSAWMNSHDVLRSNVLLMTRDAFDGCRTRFGV